MGFLTGKTAIITGAGRAVLEDGSCGSIGYGIATAYAKEGANLVITGRNVKKLEAAKEELERLYGIKVLTVQALSLIHILLNILRIHLEIKTNLFAMVEMNSLFICQILKKKIFI